LKAESLLLKLRTIAFIYHPREDRILAAVNASDPEPWSCWLTRRLALALLAKSTEFVDKSSTLAPRVSSESLDQLRSFEREAALAQTAASLSPTPTGLVAQHAPGAKLLETVTLNQRGENFEIEMRTDGVTGAKAAVNRAELQRILDMLRDTALKAGWVSGENKIPPNPAPPPRPH
jgi:hypothetical protein